MWAAVGGSAERWLMAPIHLPEPEQDDPASRGYDAWRSLIGHILGGREFITAFRNRLVLYEVVDARITGEAVYLCIRRWPGDTSTWVGGPRMGMYSMMRRRCGGFQVAGERYQLVGSRHLPAKAVVEAMSEELDPAALARLVALLETPRPELLPDPDWSRLPKYFGLHVPGD